MKSRKDNGKLGHKGGTQQPIEPVPKHPFIHSRNGRYYFRQRIPSDLVRAGCYGDAKDIKKSLRTRDLAKANGLAKSVALRVDEDFEAKRRELGRTKIETKFNSVPPQRRLSDLSETEKQDFIMRAFITNERNAGKRWNDDPEARAEMLEIVRGDLGDLDGDLNDQERRDWFGFLKKALNAEGISPDGADDALIRDLARKLQRAAVETALRTEMALNGQPYKTIDPLFKDFIAESPFPADIRPSKTIGDLCENYMAHKITRVEGGHIAKSSLPKFKMHRQIMTDFFGVGKSLESITGDDAARLVEFLATIPQNATKRYPSISLVAAAEREGKLETKRLLHPSTVQDYHAALCAMISHAMDLKWMKENPLRGRLIQEKLPKTVTRDREILTPDEMTKVFASDDFLHNRHDDGDGSQARFWVPLLCLFHATRSNEVAGMHVAEVEQAAGIAFLNLRESTEHRLKNKSSVRRVPVHQKLIDLGFLDFVAKRREEDPNGYLFTGLSRNKNGSMSDAVGKWWQRMVKRVIGSASANGPNGGRGLHSLRHSWMAAARTVGLDESIRKRLGGWSQDGAANEYGWAGALPMLKEAIDRIQFPGVEFPRVVRRIKRS